MIRLYMDVHVRREVTVGLRIRGVDVLTAQEDDAATLSDAELLTRATERGRVLFSQDTDFLRESAARSGQVGSNPCVANLGVVFS